MPQLRRGSEPVLARHFDIDHCHVRLPGERSVDHLVAATNLGDDFVPAPGAECAERKANQAAEPSSAPCVVESGSALDWLSGVSPSVHSSAERGRREPQTSGTLI
jgi:hypothetical protein